MTANAEATAEPSARTRGANRRGRNRLHRFYLQRQRFILGLVGILLVLIPWEILADTGAVNRLLLSSPSAVINAGAHEFTSAAIWDDIAATLLVWTLGFVLASVVGILLGLVAGWYPRARMITQPWLQVLYAAPELAFVPMFILWFGLGLEFKVWVVFLGVIFFTTLNTMAGVQATEARFLGVAQTYGASRRKTFQTIVLPGSVPYIMTGLRQASGRAVVATVGAEFISSNQGIGFMISVAGETLNTSRVMLGIVLLAALGIFVNEVLGRFERRFEVWRREVHG